MTTPPFKKIAGYLQAQGQELQFVLAKAKKLAELNQQIALLLDPPLREYCQVANLERGRLVILAANGSIATQLHFRLPDLLKRCQQDPALQSIREIHCKVRLSQMPSTQPADEMMKPLSPDTAEAVKEIAQSLDDPRLKAIMEKIASRVAKLPPK
ncbi:MAG: DUF721 domain-containing protein [Gammaproteobacteria bacterium]|nr:MAG: DUF721 domain-containing protein [Gammaproteobacteria bacterium]